MRYLTSLLLLWVGFVAAAQHNDNSLLFRISGNGLSAPSYLFGTLHAVPEKQFFINDSIRYCVNQSQGLVLEMETKIPIKEQISLLPRLLLPRGETLKNYMDSAAYRRFYLYLRDTMGLKEKKIDRYFRFKPVFLQAILLKELIGTPAAYDAELRKLAKKKRFTPLETLKEQLAILDSIPIADQLPGNEAGIRIKESYFELLNLYLQQDIPKLIELVSGDNALTGDDSVLLSRRNQRWLPEIEQQLKIESTFIAVGAAHLYGDSGLLALLRNRGYRITPIYCSMRK